MINLILCLLNFKLTVLNKWVAVNEFMDDIGDVYSNRKVVYICYI